MITGSKINTVGIGNGVGNRKVYCFTLCQSGIVFVGHLHGADTGTIPTADAQIGIDPIGMRLQPDLEMAGLALDRNQLGAEQNIDIFVKKFPAKAILRAGIPID